MYIPTDEQFFSSVDPTKPDIAFLKNHFYREGRLTEDQALYIIRKATEVLRAEPNVLDVDAPLTRASHIPPSARVPLTEPLQSAATSMDNMYFPLLCLCACSDIITVRSYETV